MLFQDRQQAAQQLAKLLKHYKNAADDTVIFGLPRGGVPIAYELAKTLHLPMDILLVRKLGLPGHEELAMGAISLGNVFVPNQDVIDLHGVGPDALDVVMKKEKEELARRNLKYRQEKPLPDITDKQIILTDDGIATGATLRAGIAALRQLNPRKIIVAVPVAPPSVYEDLAGEADEIIVCETPSPFYGIGMWYESFPQLEDDEVLHLMEEAEQLE